MTTKQRPAFKDTPAGKYLNDKPATLVVDGSFMTYFCHSRLIEGRPVASEDGPWPVQALLSWAGSLDYWQRLGHTVHVLWDAPFESLWRLKLHPGYKSDRRQANAESLAEKAYINTILAPLVRLYLLRRPGVTQWWCSGFEADDLVNPVLKRLESSRIGLVTADTDWEQFVDNRVSWVSLRAALCSEGVPRLESMWQVKAIVGDTADSIEGLPGLGAVSAVALFQGELESNPAQAWSHLMTRLKANDFSGLGRSVENRLQAAARTLGDMDAVRARLEFNSVLMALTEKDQALVDLAYPRWSRPVPTLVPQKGQGEGPQGAQEWLSQMTLPAKLGTRAYAELNDPRLDAAMTTLPWLGALRTALRHQGGQLKTRCPRS